MLRITVRHVLEEKNRNNCCIENSSNAIVFSQVQEKHKKVRTFSCYYRDDFCTYI